ncbi:hypothetical protein [Burkholderia contaminans]|uniref:hypothetical protein n=1 Tax=Burkholderia contaminans TaxID=488447 RepID=UPI00158D2B76|nr:hypothetical protein [Burkholderia contaminans]
MGEEDAPNANFRRVALFEMRQAALTPVGLFAHACEDLLHRQALLDACLIALADVVVASRDLPPIAS